ncbi:MAG: hypothetical protein ACREIM_05555 [Nitrospiraceae bacterium]
MNSYVISRTVPTLAWGQEAPQFHTRISLFNYYSLLFQDRPVHAVAHLYLFAEDGQERAHVQKPLDPYQQWQCDLATVTNDFRGSIGVQLVPEYLPSLKHDRFLGTLFFATYWDEQGHCDFTHETDRMRFEQDVRVQYEPAAIPTSDNVEMSIVVQNSFFGEDETKCDRSLDVEIRNGAGKRLVYKSLSLAPRASVVIPLEELLPDYRQLLHGQAGSVHVKGRHINQPLTFVRHRSGDFNIHHF